MHLPAAGPDHSPAPATRRPVGQPRTALAVLTALAACGRGGGVPIAAGPMVGHVGPDRARIWVQAAGPGWVEGDFRAEGEQEWTRSRHPDGRAVRAVLTADRQFAGVVELLGLGPATRYEYRLVGPAGPVEEDSEQSFRTPPLPGEAEAFTVAFGSCAGNWGRDPSQPVFLAVDAARPEVFLWLGDNVYFSQPLQEWTDPAAMANRWRIQRGLPNLQPLLRRTAHYAVWDDHDYGPDNSDKTFGRKSWSLELFARYWANPGYGTGGVDGVWHAFTRGRVDFFLLDERYHRDPDWMEPGPDKTLLGAAQWAWLERSLRASRADFKVVVSSTQVLARYHDYESWDLFPADRSRLLGLIRETGITGVLLLSGDRHCGEVLRWLPPEVPYPLWELTVSPLAAGLHHPPPDQEAPERLPGSVVEAEHFGLLEFRFPDGAAEAVFTPRSVAGEPLREPLEIRAAELR